MAKVVLKFNPDGEKSFNLDDNDIVKLDSLSQSTPDASGINYGCIANTGSVSIIDYNGNIANMIESGELPVSNMGVDVFFNENKIQSHITTDSSYDENTKTLNISLSNTIKDLYTRIFSGYKYPNIYKTAYDLLYIIMNEWFGKTLNEYSEFKPMLAEKIFYNGISTYTTIDSYLNSIRIQYPVIEPNQTFATVINQICELAQIQMFIDNSGNFKFISGRPVENIENIIHIPLRNISSDFRKDVFLKNNFNTVEINETVVNDITETNELCYSWKNSEHETEYTTTTDSDVKADYFNDVGFGTRPTDVYRYSNITLDYYEFTVNFDKKSNNNLNEIMEVYDGVNYEDEPYIQYSVDYLHETGKMSFEYNTSSDYASMFTPNYTKSETGTSTLATYGDFEISYPNNPYGSLVSSRTDQTNLKTVEVTYDGKYSATIKILVGITKGVAVLGRYTDNGDYYFLGNSDWAIAERYKPLEVTVNFYGIKRKITFEETSSNISDTEGNKIAVSIPLNKLLQTRTLFKTSKLSDVISNNILLDYANGVKTAKLTVVTVDYYDSNGNKVLNKDAGELIQVGDIVEVEGQKNKNGELIKWRVTGSNFKYDGEPLQELELMELVFAKDGRLYYSLNASGKAYQVQADNDEISGDLILGGQYDDGTNGLMDVASVTSSGFYNCKNIKNVLIKDNIGVVFDKAFAYSGITQLIINTEVDSYASAQAFMECTSLEKVYLLGKCYSITDYCFDGCSNLSEMYIGKNLTFIGNYALINCPNLQDIYYEGTEEDWNKIFIYDSNNSVLDNVTIHYNSKVDA